MKTTSLASALAACLGLALAPGLSLAQEKKPTELRYTTGAPPTGNPWVMQINRMAKYVEEESKGEIKIQPFFGSQLGSEQDTVQQVARGRIDMGGFSTGSAALVVPEITLLTMPGYFRDVLNRTACWTTIWSSSRPICSTRKASGSSAGPRLARSNCLARRLMSHPRT